MRRSLLLRSSQEYEDTIRKYPRLFRHKLGTVVLPESLRKRLSNSLKGYPRHALAENAKVLAEVLRKRMRARPTEASKGELKPQMWLKYGFDETQTYLAHRVPGIYATAFRVFRELGFKLPSFAPVSLLDYGAGPGTVIGAAHEIWNSVSKVTMIEPSDSMYFASQSLLKDLPLTVQRRNYLIQDVEKEHDVVVASYSLGEMQDPIERMVQLRLLWDSVSENRGLLIVIEPGTPVGFKIINDVRTELIKRGGNPIAPCPHAFKCPMPMDSWCHFKQRIRKTPLQMQTKLNKSVNYADEKYSFIVVGKGDLYGDDITIEDSVRHRVLRQPQKKGGHVLLTTCSSNGDYSQITVAKSHGREVYRSSRKAFWGDELFVEKKPAPEVVRKPRKSRETELFEKERVVKTKAAAMKKDEKVLSEKRKELESLGFTKRARGRPRTQKSGGRRKREKEKGED